MKNQMTKLDKIFSIIIILLAVAVLLFGLLACCTGHIIGIAFGVLGVTLIYVLYCLYDDKYGGS